MEREPLWARAAGRVVCDGEEFVEEHGRWVLGLFLVVAILAGVAFAAGFGAVEIMLASALLAGFGVIVALFGRD